MVKFMMDNLKMEKLMVMELFIIQAVKLLIKVIGKMNNLKEMVLYIMKSKKSMIILIIMIFPILMKCGLNTKANSRIAKNTDVVLYILQMVMNSKEILKKMKLMAKANI